MITVRVHTLGGSELLNADFLPDTQIEDVVEQLYREHRLAHPINLVHNGQPLASNALVNEIIVDEPLICIAGVFIDEETRHIEVSSSVFAQIQTAVQKDNPCLMVRLLRFHSLHPDYIPYAQFEEHRFDPYGDIGEKSYTVSITWYLSQSLNLHTSSEGSSVSLKMCTETCAPSVHRRFCEAPDANQAAAENSHFDSWIQQIRAKEEAELEKKRIRERSIEEIVEIPSASVPKLIGKRGATIKALQDEFGLLNDIAVNQAECDIHKCTLFGLPENVALAAAHIREFTMLDVSETVQVPSAALGCVIGKAGAMRKQLMDEFKCWIRVESGNTDQIPIVVTGRPAAVSQASDRLREIIADRDTWQWNGSQKQVSGSKWHNPKGNDSWSWTESGGKWRWNAIEWKQTWR